jgi:hypothetical protein
VRLVVDLVETIFDLGARRRYLSDPGPAIVS